MTAAALSSNSVIISRKRSMSTTAAMSIDRTTSANSTVTCLYSAVSSADSCDPPLSQKRAPSCGAAPHDRHNAVGGVSSSAADPKACTDWLMRKAYGVPRAPKAEKDNIDARDSTRRQMACSAQRLLELSVQIIRLGDRQNGIDDV